MRKNHLNINRQFMIGNFVLAFAVILVVVIFIYMALRLQRAKQEEHYYTEQYDIILESGFKGEEMIIYANDSILTRTVIDREPLPVHFSRFDESTTLMVVNARTESLFILELEKEGGTYRLKRQEDQISQIQP